MIPVTAPDWSGAYLDAQKSGTPLETALTYLRAGLNVVPFEADGSKQTLRGYSWMKLKKEMLSETEARSLFNTERLGIGIVCGAISGNLEVFDIETAAVRIAYWNILKKQKPDLAAKLDAIAAPRGGMHIRVKRTGAANPGAKLAYTAKGETLIETRGEGNLILAPGSHPNTHPTGKPYLVIQGDLTNIAIVTDDEYEYLRSLAVSFNEYIQPEQIYREPTIRDDGEQGDRPGDDFNRRADWADTLPAGSKCVGKRGEVYLIRRPGKREGHSATINIGGSDLLYVFSSSFLPFEPNRAYTKFAAYTLLNHGGDFSEAARALREQGYGADTEYGDLIVSELDDIDAQPAPASNVDTEQSNDVHVGEPEDNDRSTDTNEDPTKTELELPEKTRAIDWEPPILFDSEYEMPELPVSLLPSPLREHCASVAAFSQTPTGLGMMIMLSVLATAAQGRVVVAPDANSYKEPLCLWTVTALPPGSRKTSVLNAMTVPLLRWETNRQKALAPAIKRDTLERTVLTRQVADLEKKAAAAKDDIARGKLITQAIELQNGIKEPLYVPRLFTQDATAERLQSMLAENGGRMAVISDEAVIFDVMTGLYSNGVANMDVFLQSWSASPVRVDRGQRTVTLEAPVLSFGLCIQPTVIARLSKGDGQLRGRGTLGRFLICMPRSNIGRRNVYETKELDEQAAERYNALITRLLDIEPTATPRVMNFTKEARKLRLAFAQDIENRQGEHGDLAPIQDWSAKLTGQAARIAGLLQLAKDPMSNEVDAESVQSANEICTLLIDHARYAFELMSNDPSVTDAKYLASWLKDKGYESVKRTEMLLLGRFKNAGSTKRLESAVRVLQQRNILSAATKSRPVTYAVNPKLLSRESGAHQISENE